MRSKKSLLNSASPEIKFNFFPNTTLINGTSLKEEAVKSGLVTEKEYEKIVNPKKMIKPY